MSQIIRKKLPPREEWDFRAVDAAGIPTVTLYEYARSAEGLRKRVIEWLCTKIGARTVRQHLFSAIGKTREEEAKLKSQHPELIDRITGSIASKILNAGERADVPIELLTLIAEYRPDFPRPWLAFPMRFASNKKFSRVLCTPLAWTLKHINESPDPEKRLAFLESALSRSYKLSIDWSGSTKSEILDHLSRWLDKEFAKRAPSKRGAQSQTPTWKLKNLAVWRLRQSGFSYVQAQTEIALLPGDEPEKNRSILPVFANASKWTDAFQGAQQELLRVEKLPFNHTE